MNASTHAPSDAAWRAILRRDRRFDGQFVYIALTTNIYCRPSCPARLPQRQHVVILSGPETAERGGYSACRRCHPRSNAPAPVEKGIRLALEFIGGHLDERITLLSLARSSDLSPQYLQRVFSRIVGISPRAFCDFQRVQHLKRLLRSGRPVSTAVYDAGYGSLRAVYERSARTLGMTPAVYQRGGEGVDVRYATTRAELGETLIAASSSGICMVVLGRAGSSVRQELERELPAARLSRITPAPFEWTRAVLQAEREDPLVARLDRDTRQSVFRANVWTALTIAAPS
jgi:AraC family transcriptional regulator of adaptative response/methylated-DNA-[protein]-cysteine methyltransferase